ncbi:unnamed protein product (macronuclear) [Paramecium tetraurelia]|uniref:Uncharacterized protein n=1 Tax=Paramecium tetraurelia TaxID=5888 RepID=A0C4H7_PARTE|nr:uncharacterized protein GSPATT00035174001 [Paramecium tetraurelia]CAK65694.1 unnamed protein product [Paramecium tetraurelia]|eukprot:XP_001433091.1 hypothetical protein (macronuclear) [Paramecium tetraurelia strain d4-2]
MIKYLQRSLFRISDEYEYLKCKDIFKSQLGQFKKALNKAIQLQKQIDQNTQAAYKMQSHAFFTSNVPSKTILAAFLQKREYSNEEIVGQTFVQLGHALKGRGDRSYFDHKQIESSMGFDVLIKDLLNLNDYRILAEGIHGLALTGVDLHSEQIVEKAFQQLDAKELNSEEKQLIEAFILDIFEEKKDVPMNNFIYEVEKMIEETQSDIFYVLEAIVEIRRVYLKLLDIQKSDWIHVNTNIKMMEFEEALVSTGLLHPVEVEKEDISLSLETALSYISGRDPNLMAFIISLLEIKLIHKDQIKPVEPKLSDFGNLMVAVSEYKGHQIAERLKNAQSLLVHSDKYKLAKAFANAGLNVESREYLAQVTDEELLNSVDSLHLHLQLNKTDRQFPLPENLSILSLDELIAYATYLALQNQNYGLFIEELKFRVKNLNTIRDLNEKQQERIDVLEKHSGQKLIYEEKDINRTEVYKAIKETLPKSVQLIEIYDLSLNNEINGYAKLRVGSQPYMTLYDFLGKDKEQFKQKLQLAFNLENSDIILFNKIKDRLESVQIEENSKELSSQTIFNAQWQYLKKRALNYLNKNDNLNKLKLKQTLLDLQERLNILNQNNVFQDLIDEIKVQPIKFPKWYGMIPSQSIYNPQSSIEGFKASLISNRIYDPTYCPDQDLFKRLEENGFISDVLPIPHSDKRRQQIVVESYSLAWKKHSAKKSDEELEQLNQLYKFLQKDQKDHHSDASDLFIANLLNLNAELKSKSLPEIADFVFNIKFWDKLIEERLSANKSTKPTGIYLQRDPEVILHEQIKQYNPFLTTQYLKKKLEVNKTLDDLIKMRKELLMKLQEDVKNKEINKQQAKSIVRKINRILYDKIQDIKGELRRKHSSPYYKQKTNYIDILFNESDIEKLDIQQTPDRYLDVDLLYGINEFVTRKRSRAEEKLITYYLMNKQMEGKQLNKQELQFLDSLSLYQPNVQVTQLRIKDMQFDDLIHSDFKQFGEFSASDLLLQLSQLFDDQLFLDILSHKYYKKLGIQHQFRRRDNQLYLQQQEKLVWIEESRLNDVELKDLKEMLQIGNASDQHVESLNQTDYPLQNVYSWIHAKSAEKFDLSLLDQHNQELWNNIFKCQYENTTEQQLHDVVNLLVERYYILQFHPVTYLRQLLRMILTHPNLSALDKKNLQCLKKTVGFNSEDILAISKSERAATVPSYLSEMCYPYGEKLSII